MSLPYEPIVKKFFTNKIESSRNDWGTYLHQIARIFYDFDGQVYDREMLLERFKTISGRSQHAYRDASNFRDEFGAYGTYLGVYHLEQKENKWRIVVSEAAKRYLCCATPNVEAFCRIQLSLFQYPNGAGTVISRTGSLSVQGNIKNDTVREIENGIRINPLRLLSRIVVAQHEIGMRPLPGLVIPYKLLFLLVNDVRINTSYSPPLELIYQVIEEYSASETPYWVNQHAITNFKRNFHILEKTGLFWRTQHSGLVIPQTNQKGIYKLIKAISNMEVCFSAFEDCYSKNNVNSIKDIIMSPSWGQYYDNSSIPDDILKTIE